MTSPNSETLLAMSKDELLVHFKTLGIRSLIDDNLDDFLSVAKNERWSARTVLEQLVKREIIERERRSLAWRLRDCKIGSFAPMADFDWGWPEKINRQTIERLLTADFVAQGDNAVLVGTPEFLPQLTLIVGH